MNPTLTYRPKSPDTNIGEYRYFFNGQEGDNQAKSFTSTFQVLALQEASKSYGGLKLWWVEINKKHFHRTNFLRNFANVFF